MNGWTGKRLLVDLSLHRSWIEEIPVDDLRTVIGGRGLNGRFLLNWMRSQEFSASADNPIAFAVGPLAGTPAPCSGWTSLSAISEISPIPGYVTTGLPGHWGPQLKFAGFDQLVILGRAEHPVYLSVEGEVVRFEDGRPLWGKDTVETTVAIRDKGEDGSTEVLCIGPGGENLVFFANVTNRFSWTADRAGFGALFGSKNLKAVSIHGQEPVKLYDPDLFLQNCLAHVDRIRREPRAVRLREEGAFLTLKQDGEGLGIRNYATVSRQETAQQWGALYFRDHAYGKEGCFACPIHCGRISEVNGTYFGGVHLETAWSLGPRIGVEEWEKTLLLHRTCQLEGLDPMAAGSLLSWIMDCCEKGILSSRDLGNLSLQWGDDKGALRLIREIVRGNDTGKILARGSFQAARSLGKGMEEVPHFCGRDLPVRDPRSSRTYALGCALFPGEGDYLQSLLQDRTENRESAALNSLLSAEALRILADLNSLCPLIVVRFPLLSASDIGELITAATGEEGNEQWLLDAVGETLRIEKALWQRSKPWDSRVDRFPLRFFRNPAEQEAFGKEVDQVDLLAAPPTFSGKENRS
jgi:aldehyde:ferredoxin oxidoreductase